MINRDQFHLMLQNLEFLAGGWELDGQAGAAEDLRTLLMAYLEPELRVRYFYAAEWRTGRLLLGPNQTRHYWQIQRDDIGAMVDQVVAGPDRIRVLVEGTEPPAKVSGETGSGWVS